MGELSFKTKRKKKNTASAAQQDGSLSFKGGRRKRHRKRAFFFGKREKKITKASVAEWALFLVKIAVVCATAFLLVFFFGNRISIAGDAMEPQLENGEMVLVDRLCGNIVGFSRGTVVAFYPDGTDTGQLSVRRVAALPGETVQIADGCIYVDGEKLDGTYFPDEIEYAGLAETEITLGDNEYFLIGDNAGSAGDSRYANVGAVDDDEIYGRVWFVTTRGEHFGFIKTK